ncbi:hypothetical protein Mal15_18200 [Stieleria maiorica]|uniref:Uncharacterized protein n=1 Tax=Stieleria maiorica TaxID=2795974 RepID=A0A5B9MC41_9BACT|nr:hypothetical protein Mal15_18200 [Stieleria maiorica]
MHERSVTDGLNCINAPYGGGLNSKVTEKGSKVEAWVAA